VSLWIAGGERWGLWTNDVFAVAAAGIPAGSGEHHDRYSTAQSVHDIDEPSAFSPVGPFAEWVRSRNGWSMNCGWAAAAERHADGEAPLEVFFRLLDECRSQD
jgi:hypothetical protein